VPLLSTVALVLAGSSVTLFGCTQWHLKLPTQPGTSLNASACV
jgi:hypothetical protein